MDGHVAWFRAQLRRALIGRLRVEALLVAVLAVASAVVGRLPPVPVAAGAVAALVLRVVWAIETNPWNRKNLARYLDREVVCVPVPDDGEVTAAVVPLLALGFRRVATAGEPDDPTVHYDLLRSTDAFVLAVVTRSSGSCLLVSALHDGRLLATSTMQLPPTTRVVSNTVPGAEVAALRDAHWAALRRIVADPHDLVPVPIGSFVTVLEEERAAHLAIGRLSVFLDLGGRGRSARLTVAVPPAKVLALGVAPGTPSRAPEPAVATNAVDAHDTRRDEVAALRDEVLALRHEVAGLREHLAQVRLAAPGQTEQVVEPASRGR